MIFTYSYRNSFFLFLFLLKKKKKKRLYKEGKKKAKMGDEASAEDVELEESKRWPYEARFSSKKWKIRSEAYKSVAKDLEDETADAPIVKQISTSNGKEEKELFWI